MAVALFGIETGIVVAILLSLADRTRRAARPNGVILGREPGTVHWIPPDVGHPTEQVPGILVYLIYAPLWYGNAEYVRLRIVQMLDSAADPVRALVLDANGISDIDYTGVRMLGELIAELKQREVAIGMARSSHLIHRQLERGGLLQSLGPDRMFATVEEAAGALVAAAEGGPATSAQLWQQHRALPGRGQNRRTSSHGLPTVSPPPRSTRWTPSSASGSERWAGP